MGDPKLAGDPSEKIPPWNCHSDVRAECGNGSGTWITLQRDNNHFFSVFTRGVGVFDRTKKELAVNTSSNTLGRCWKRASAGGFFEKIHVGTIDSASGSAHTDFAGSTAGIARVGSLAQNLGCFPFCGGLGQFWNEKASIAGKGATACAFWNQYPVAAGLCNAFQFCCDPHFRHRAHGMQSDGISLRANGQLG
jgi:hypothetical protein